ncbi:hypothetical protein LQZ19_14775 [Treponema primitia]
MAFQVTGQEAHEWTGAGMFVLFLILGLHWGMVITMFQKPMKRTPILTLPAPVPMCIAIAIAVYGAWNFYKMNILSYMFLRSQFAFFDFEKNALAVFAENTAMMGLWICAAYYAAKFLKKIHTTKNL